METTGTGDPNIFNIINWIKIYYIKMIIIYRLYNTPDQGREFSWESYHVINNLKKYVLEFKIIF